MTRQLTLESLKKLGDSIIRVASKYAQLETAGINATGLHV